MIFLLTEHAHLPSVDAGPAPFAPPQGSASELSKARSIEIAQITARRCAADMREGV